MLCSGKYGAFCLLNHCGRCCAFPANSPFILYFIFTVSEILGNGIVGSVNRLDVPRSFPCWLFTFGERCRVALVTSR